MNTNLTIVEARDCDVGVLIRLSKVLFPYVFDRHDAEWWSATIDSPQAEVWLGKTAGQVSGFLILETSERQMFSAPVKKRLLRIVSNPRSIPLKLSDAIATNLYSQKSLTDRTGETPSPSLYLKGVGTNPEYQRQGIGNRLVEFAEQRACHLGFDCLKLIVRRDNQGAIQIYKRRKYCNMSQYGNYITMAKGLPFCAFSNPTLAR